MMPLIRPATTDDAETLARFAEAMALETEDKRLAPDTVRAGINAVLADAAKGFYIVAEHEAEVVGVLMVTTEWSDWRNGTFWWIQSVYVRPEARRQGVYTAMHEHVRQDAEGREDVCGLRLYVEAENTRAQRTYERMGMTPTTYRLYTSTA